MWNGSKSLAVRPRAHLRLEPLEDRTLPSSANTGAVVQPPSQFQAVRSLVIDAAYLETLQLLQSYVTNFGTNPGAIDEFGFTPSVTTVAYARAAADGVNFNSIVSLNTFLSSVLIAEGIQGGALDDIQFNLPYAGPFGLFALKAGVDAALQAVHQ